MEGGESAAQEAGRQRLCTLTPACPRARPSPSHPSRAQKYQPLDLRSKKTRAQRRVLTKSQVIACVWCVCVWVCGWVGGARGGAHGAMQRGDCTCRHLARRARSLPLCLTPPSASPPPLPHPPRTLTPPPLQAGAKTERQAKKDRAFPKRKYALKA